MCSCSGFITLCSVCIWTWLCRRCCTKCTEFEVLYTAYRCQGFAPGRQKSIWKKCAWSVLVELTFGSLTALREEFTSLFSMRPRGSGLDLKPNFSTYDVYEWQPLAHVQRESACGIIPLGWDSKSWKGHVSIFCRTCNIKGFLFGTLAVSYRPTVNIGSNETKG